MRLIILFSQTLLTQIFPAVPQGVILSPETGCGSAETNRQKENLNSSGGRKRPPGTQKTVAITQKSSALKKSCLFLQV